MERYHIHFGLQEVIRVKVMARDKVRVANTACAADDAYPCSNSLLTPWPGTKLPLDKDSFNFYQSSLRITVECAFGQFVNRWGVFWRALRFPIALSSKVVLACMRLHNFCADARRDHLGPDTFNPEDWWGEDFEMKWFNQGDCDLDAAHVMSGIRRDLEKADTRAILTDQLKEAARFRPGHSTNGRNAK